MSNQPLDKGRIAVIVERYPSKNIDQQTGQPIMKARYANVGRATKWITNGVEQIEQEIDCMPLGVTGPVKLYIFWDSQQSNNQQQAPQQGGYQQQAPQQGGYQQQAPQQGGYQQQRG